MSLDFWLLYSSKKFNEKRIDSSAFVETSSGSEILKRLIKNGLVDEIKDPNDKRAKRVLLTDKGKRTVFQSFDEMHKISEIIIGNLNQVEIKQVLQAFNKLTYFHQHIHASDRTSDLDFIHHKYIETIHD